MEQKLNTLIILPISVLEVFFTNEQKIRRNLLNIHGIKIKSRIKVVSKPQPNLRSYFDLPDLQLKSILISKIL